MKDILAELKELIVLVESTTSYNTGEILQNLTDAANLIEEEVNSNYVSAIEFGYIDKN